MIEIPIVKPPNILTDLLTEFRPLFDRRQFRQFSRYISSSWVSPTRSVAHMNGIFLEHTNQSNLNRFLRNIPVLEIFRKSADLINRHSSDSLMVIDDTILERNGRHIDGAGWVFDHTRGKSIWGMQKYHCCHIRERRHISSQPGSKGKIMFVKNSDADGCHQPFHYSRSPFQHRGIRFMVFCIPPSKVSGEGEEGLNYGSQEQQEDIPWREIDEPQGLCGFPETQRHDCIQYRQ